MRQQESIGTSKQTREQRNRKPNKLIRSKDGKDMGKQDSETEYKMEKQ